jgi:hypothetical protein
MKRGTGETTRQMQNAPKGSVFVWCNSYLEYPVRLAISIGRDDLLVKSPGWLEKSGRGSEFRNIVVDHAASLSAEQSASLLYLRRLRGKK